MSDFKTKTNTPLRTDIEKEKMYYEYYKIFWNYNEDSYKELCWETRDAKLRLEELNIHECCVCQEDKPLGKLSDYNFNFLNLWRSDKSKSVKKSLEKQ